jgi:hypothetical protein
MSTPEKKIRRWSKQLGLVLRRSRARMLHINNRGGYMLIEPYANAIVAGERFDLSIAEVEEVLADREKGGALTIL